MGRDTPNSFPDEVATLSTSSVCDLEESAISPAVYIIRQSDSYFRSYQEFSTSLKKRVSLISSKGDVDSKRCLSLVGEVESRKVEVQSQLLEITERLAGVVSERFIDEQLEKFKALKEKTDRDSLSLKLAVMRLEQRAKSTNISMWQKEIQLINEQLATPEYGLDPLVMHRIGVRYLGLVSRLSAYVKRADSAERTALSKMVKDQREGLKGLEDVQEKLMVSIGEVMSPSYDRETALREIEQSKVKDSTNSATRGKLDAKYNSLWSDYVMNANVDLSIEQQRLTYNNRITQILLEGRKLVAEHGSWISVFMLETDEERNSYLNEFRRRFKEKTDSSERIDLDYLMSVLTIELNKKRTLTREEISKIAVDFNMTRFLDRLTSVYDEMYLLQLHHLSTRDRVSLYYKSMKGILNRDERAKEYCLWAAVPVPQTESERDSYIEEFKRRLLAKGVTHGVALDCFLRSLNDKLTAQPTLFKDDLLGIYQAIDEHFTIEHVQQVYQKIRQIQDEFRDVKKGFVKARKTLEPSSKDQEGYRSLQKLTTQGFSSLFDYQDLLQTREHCDNSLDIIKHVSAELDKMDKYLLPSSS